MLGRVFHHVEFEVSPDEIDHNYVLLRYVFETMRRKGKKGETLNRLVKILWAVALKGGEAEHGWIEEVTGIKPSTLSDSLERLGNYYRLIKYEERKPIKLMRKTPLCFLAEAEKVPYVYVGLLGWPPGPVREKERPELETLTAKRFLEKDKELKGERIEKIFIVTTADVIKSWEDFLERHESMYRLDDEGKQLYEEMKKILEEAYFKYLDDLNNREKVKEVAEDVIKSLVENYIVILDPTGGPRPAGFAYFELANKHMTPLVYVFKDLKTGEVSLHWEIGREQLKKELSFMLPSDVEQKRIREKLEQKMREKMIIRGL